jgi:hypothetical protein
MTGPLRGKGKHLKRGKGGGGGGVGDAGKGGCREGKAVWEMQARSHGKAISLTRKHHVIFPFLERVIGGCRGRGPANGESKWRSRVVRRCLAETEPVTRPQITGAIGDLRKVRIFKHYYLAVFYSLIQIYICYVLCLSK